MSKLQQINVFLNEKLKAVPLEISVVVKKTIAEYQEEIYRLKQANARLRRLLDLVFKPEIKLHRFADLQQLTLTEEEVNPEQQHYEQEWSANLGPVEPDAEESIWNSINIITVENQTEFDVFWVLSWLCLNLNNKKLNSCGQKVPGFPLKMKMGLENRSNKRLPMVWYTQVLSPLWSPLLDPLQTPRTQSYQQL
ncbi:hypothetical protein J4Q44_G00362980 [Coregonus suidteri]|uniref:Uncharacterized protein n=1 Tax=Coregonus suidteri TaxID=861788 RepID=A0AAN8KJV4_9TELE